ncbi:hypothetical protein B0H15DRAFT_851483 [Mycena belliarum]|uniref:Uncharacterized protein n=1 Tax=Mycena belliarum TaxID=1033014 RepID=A0AAD6XNC4_9AGAR|nr:hypothetical protein B0H15DRAFT_851483 [Mycena belliae]
MADICLPAVAIMIIVLTRSAGPRAYVLRASRFRPPALFRPSPPSRWLSSTNTPPPPPARHAASQLPLVHASQPAARASRTSVLASPHLRRTRLLPRRGKAARAKSVFWPHRSYSLLANRAHTAPSLRPPAPFCISAGL